MIRKISLLLMVLLVSSVCSGRVLTAKVEKFTAEGYPISFTETDPIAIQYLDQAVKTTSSPTFIAVTLSGLTTGSILFAGTNGVISQDNSNLFWDDANNRLGIGTTPNRPLHVASATSGITIQGTAGFGTLDFESSNGVSGNILGVIRTTSKAVSGDDAAQIRFELDGAAGASNNPTALVFKTGTSAGGTERMRITSLGNVTITGTLTVNGDQTGATDHVFDDYNDIELLLKWRDGEKLPFETGDILNRDRLLRDTIIQQQKQIDDLKIRLEKLEK